MDRIALIGLSWRQGGPNALARFTLAPEVRAERLPEVAAQLGVDEIVYMATCNRVEVALALKPDASIGDARRLLFRALAGRTPAPGEAERSMKAWAGEGAAEHLFLVAAGLDSARLGETEISGQVKDALEQARALGLAGRRLGPLFDEALKISRRVRGATAIGAGRTSLAEIALEALRERLGAATNGAASQVALIGVSPMTKRCGAALAEDGHALLVVNRTLAHAQALCDELGPGARALPLDRFRAEPEPVAALVSATAARSPLFGVSELAKLARAGAPLLVDLAVPPDVDADAARAHGLERLGMEEILAAAERTRAARAIEFGEARALVDEALNDLRHRWRGRAIDAAVVALRAHYRERALGDLEAVLRRDLRGVGETERDALRGFATSLANKLAHLPSSGLREVVAEHGASALDAFLQGADPALARALYAALQEDPVKIVDEEEIA